MTDSLSMTGPHDPTLIVELHRRLAEEYALHDPEQMIAELLSAVRVDPHDPRGYALLADGLRSAGRTEEASRVAAALPAVREGRPMLFPRPASAHVPVPPRRPRLPFAIVVLAGLAAAGLALGIGGDPAPAAPPARATTAAGSAEPANRAHVQATPSRPETKDVVLPATVSGSIDWMVESGQLVNRCDLIARFEDHDHWEREIDRWRKQLETYRGDLAIAFASIDVDETRRLRRKIRRAEDRLLRAKQELSLRELVAPESGRLLHNANDALAGEPIGSIARLAP